MIEDIIFPWSLVYNHLTYMGRFIVTSHNRNRQHDAYLRSGRMPHGPATISRWVMEIRYRKSPHFFELGGGFKLMFFMFISVQVFGNMIHFWLIWNHQLVRNLPPRVHHFLISKKFPHLQGVFAHVPKDVHSQTQTQLKHGILEIVTMLQILHKTAKDLGLF